MTYEETSNGQAVLDLCLPTANLPRLEPGSVWLTGAGPGDPALLTVLGLWGMKQADVILHDALINPDILDFARKGAEKVDVGKRAGQASANQAAICERLIHEARAGLRVLRLKGGDPFVFARGGEEAQALVAAEIPFRLVPGITSGVAALGYAGIPSTHRDLNQSITFISAHDRAGGLNQKLDWQAHARTAEVLVVYMGSRLLADVCQKFLEGGRSPDEPLALISRATWADQKVVTSTLGLAGSDPALKERESPALIVIGDVVKLRAELDWFGRLAAKVPSEKS